MDRGVKIALLSFAVTAGGLSLAMFPEANAEPAPVTPFASDVDDASANHDLAREAREALAQR